MEVDTNWLAILGATAVAMVAGMVWYHPKVFGTRWMKAVGLTKKQMDSGQTTGMILAVIRSLAVAFALYHIIYVTADFYSEDSFLQNAIGVGVWVGVAIVGISMAMHDAFEQRTKLITRVNAGFQIVTIVLMSVVIGLIAG